MLAIDLLDIFCEPTMYIELESFVDYVMQTRWLIDFEFRYSRRC